MTRLIDDHEIIFDTEYTQALNDKVRGRFGPNRPRNATHVSDLFFCLKKAYGKRKALEAGEEEWQPDEETLLTWMGGLQFEELISEGEKQSVLAYCFKCKAVSSPQYTPTGEEPAHCVVCGERHLLMTPDYIVDGVIHEAKQTRKSRRRGVEAAPWWIEQLRSYVFLFRRAGQSASPYGRLVVNWLMGDYGRKKKGLIPLPPRAALDAYKVVFKEGFEDEWEGELRRRKDIVEGEEMPPLSWATPDDMDSPVYDWECSSCPVGLPLGCELYIWDKDGVEIKEEENDNGS